MKISTGRWCNTGDARWRASSLLVLLLAWGLLLFCLNDVPPGFQHDQTFNIIDVIDLLHGHYRLYFPANFGREPLFFYTVAGVLRLTGLHFVWGLRFTSVLWGMLGIAMTISLARRYLPYRAAVFATILMAGSFWFLFIARVGLRAISLLPLATAMIYFLDRGLVRCSLRDLAVAGLLGGLTVYTYLAARALLLLVPLLLVYEAVSAFRRRFRPDWRERAPSRGTAVLGLFISFVLMVLISSPLFLYLRARPAIADRRLVELQAPFATALHGNLRPALQSAWETMLSLLWAGPAAPSYQYNLPGRPALQPIWAVFFLVGLFLLLACLRRRRAFLLLMALLLGLAPDLLTFGGPLYLRGIIALPLVFILVVRGFRRAVSAGIDILPQGNQTLRSLLPIVVSAGLLVWHLADGGYAYFITWARAPETHSIYNADLRTAAAFLNTHATDEPVFISTDFWMDLDQQTYLLYEPRRRDIGWFNASIGLPLPSEEGTLYLLTASLMELPPSLSCLAGDMPNRFLVLAPSRCCPVLLGFRLSPTNIEEAGRCAVWSVVPPLVFGEALRLEAAGAHYHDYDNHVEFISRWTVLSPWPHPLVPGLSVSLCDAAAYKWAQVDDITALAFQSWHVGDAFVQVARIPLPSDIPPGDYTLHLRVYDDSGGLTPMRNGIPLGTAPTVTTVQVTQHGDRDAPPFPPLAVEQTLQGEKLRLLGKWETLDSLLADVPTNLHLSWQAVQTVATSDLSFRLRATDGTGHLLWEQEAKPLAALPPVWAAGQVYRLTHRLQPEVSAQQDVFEAQLEFCAVQGDTMLACGIIARPQITNHPPLLALPRPPQCSSNAEWDGQIALAGYDLLLSGETISLTLYWRTMSPPSVSLKRFVHALDRNGQIVAQSDDTPENGGIPMPFWRSGEYVPDKVVLQIPEGQDVVSLHVGFYVPETGERLSVAGDGADPATRRLLLTTVRTVP